MKRLASRVLLACAIAWACLAPALAASGSGGTNTTTSTTDTVNRDQGTINAGSIFEGRVTVSGALSAALVYSWGQLKVSRDVLEQLRGSLSPSSVAAINDFYATACSSLPSNLELLTASGSVAYANPYLYYSTSGDVNATGFEGATTFQGADVLGIESHVVGGRTAAWNPAPTTATRYLVPLAATATRTSTSTHDVRVGEFVLGTDTEVRTTTTRYTGQAEVTVYEVSGSKYVSPLVLDLAGQGRLEASGGDWLPHATRFDRKRVALFDFYANGFEVMMEWVGPQDGLLLEPHADGTVDGSCLFGTTGGFLNGFDKLATRDLNHDGVISGHELDGLQVWQDRNGNARIDEGELRSVKALGITEISLRHSNYRSTFVMNGGRRVMWDWWPTALELKKVRVAQDPSRR